MLTPCEGVMTCAVSATPVLVVAGVVALLMLVGLRTLYRSVVTDFRQRTEELRKANKALSRFFECSSAVVKAGAPAELFLDTLLRIEVLIASGGSALYFARVVGSIHSRQIMGDADLLQQAKLRQKLKEIEVSSPGSVDEFLRAFSSAVAYVYYRYPKTRVVILGDLDFDQLGRSETWLRSLFASEKERVWPGAATA